LRGNNEYRVVLRRASSVVVVVAVVVAVAVVVVVGIVTGLVALRLINSPSRGDYPRPSFPEKQPN
jgi:hypothetical protein